MYFATGATLMLVVDPIRRQIEVFEAGGIRTEHDGDATVTFAAFPDLALSFPALFARLDPP